MTLLKSLSIAISLLTLTACAETLHKHDPADDLGLLWVKYSAEYRANALQTYRSATEDLPRFVEDTSWHLVATDNDPSELPPAVILDVDETVVSNVNFQLTFERPFANHKLESWAANNEAMAVPGVKSFVDFARSSGVAVFFVTNRPCQKKEGSADPCPQQQTTIDGIHEIGLEVDAEHVMLSGQEPGWDREKLSRREHIAKTHRVIMLIGDDFSDFAPCVREEPHGACTDAATLASRTEALHKYQEFWGNGWYILPNPMHGSWTSVRE